MFTLAAVVSHKNYNFTLRISQDVRRSAEQTKYPGRRLRDHLRLDTLDS